ncbi:GNAT family N-acetyltransferase [Paenibacillus illinoisensis]|uniref:GNAT family N-acetyltransferase n=1 Tax=Paenibacillus illinoisensis TaxID=59845 RepID=UPI003A4DFD1D
MDQISIGHIPPTAAEYLALRQIAGLSAMSKEGAEIGLPNSLFAVCLRDGDELVGMGRVIGDGGCFFQVVDIAVHPDVQGRGYGKLIMSEIMKYLREHVPARGLVSLLADVPADRLYSQFGFTYTSPKSEGMWWRQREDGLK